MAASQKVGVLTFHRCINYGSYWQARRLVEGLRALGRDAVLLDHDCPHVNRAEWRCALQPLLPERSSAEDRRAYAAKTRRFIEAFGTLPLSPRFGLDDPAGLDDYDVIVVGSDEVWNLCHPWYGGRALFYGKGLKARRLVSYAASFGNHNAADGLPDWWAERLGGFAAISVRDDNSARLIRAALGREPELVLDPCLQFPPAVPPAPRAAGEPYLVVYGHGFPGWFRRAVTRWAAAAGCRIVSIGYRNGWADEQRIAAGPEAFARLMAGACAVATNFFHGCVFALLNAVPFVCLPSDYRSNKVRDLTRALGAEERLVTGPAEDGAIAGLLSAPPHPAVFERIAGLRRRSAAYLADALA